MDPGRSDCHEIQVGHIDGKNKYTTDINTRVMRFITVAPKKIMLGLIFFDGRNDGQIQH